METAEILCCGFDGRRPVWHGSQSIAEELATESNESEQNLCWRRIFKGFRLFLAYDCPFLKFLRYLNQDEWFETCVFDSLEKGTPSRAKNKTGLNKHYKQNKQTQEFIEVPMFSSGNSSNEPAEYLWLVVAACNEMSKTKRVKRYKT